VVCASQGFAQEVASPIQEPKSADGPDDRPYETISPFAPSLPLAAPEALRTSGRSVACDPFSFDEDEPNCGIDENGQPDDLFNGGCGADFAFFYPLFCDDIVCGTSVFTGAVRDGDWYEITATGQTFYTWQVTPDFDAVIGMAGGTNGVPDCALVTGINPFKIVPRGTTASVSVCVTSGTYWFVVLPNFGQAPFPCGRNYEARITCQSPCPGGGCCLGAFCQHTTSAKVCSNLGGVYQGDFTECNDLPCTPPLNDDCANAELFQVGATLKADLRLATLSSPTEPPACAGAGGVGSVWYKFQGTGSTVRIESCSSDATDPAATDAVIAVYTGTCGNLTLRRCSDDAGCGATGRQAAVCTAQTQTNITYYVQVLAWSNSSRGVYTITTSQPCTDPLPPGACCIPTLFGPACAVTTPEDCALFSGVFKGTGVACTLDPNVLCPNVAVPVNDECDSAILLTSGAPQTGSLQFASSSGTFEDCGLPIEGNDLWYKVIGTGRTLTVSLCSPITDFDAQLHVYCDNCGQADYTCVAANDDQSDGSCGLKPEVSWCSETGATYIINVSGVNGGSGAFEIKMTDDFVLCSNPPDCSGLCNLSCPPGAVPENEAQCGPQFVDTINGGCSAEPPVFGVIEPGQTICGGSGTFPIGTQSGRDVDWFRFTIEQKSVVTWELDASFLVETFILNDECGINLESYGLARGNGCQSISVTATLEPGTYSILVEPQFFGGVQCSSALWFGTLTATPTADNGACCLTETSCVDTSEAHCGELGGSYASNGVFCATVNCVPVPDCPADFNGDGKVNVADFNILALHFGMTSGATHAEGDANGDGKVNVADFNLVAFSFAQPCAGTQVSGACCINFTTCQQMTSEACTIAGGSYQGNNIGCATVDCDPCPADFNGNHVVNVADFNILALHFGQIAGASRSDGDATLDGKVTVADFNILAGAFAQPCG